MTLEDFLGDCRKKGAIPLSFRNHAEALNGSSSIEYDNPSYAEAKKRLAKILNPNPGDAKINDLLSRFYGEEIVIHTSSGYHYGTLNGYDGKRFLLGNYYFYEKLIDTFDYVHKALFSSDSIVPSENIISISKIPLVVEHN